eukprot:1982298-Pleurochrysis_carterae.AAC.1
MAYRFLPNKTHRKSITTPASFTDSAGKHCQQARHCRHRVRQRDQASKASLTSSSSLASSTRPRRLERTSPTTPSVGDTSTVHRYGRGATS